MKIAAYAFFYGSLGLWLFLATFVLFVGEAVAFFGTMLAAPGIATGTVMILLYAAIKPSWTKTRQLFVALSVGAVGLAADSGLRTAGVKLFWAIREPQATAFVAELLSYGRIREMDTGNRHFKELNGELVAYSANQVDTTHLDGLRPTLPVQSVLTRDGIDPRVYEGFRERLRALGFLHVEIHDDYIGFVRDGILDNLYGFAWIRPGHRPPKLGGEFVDETQLVLLQPLGGHWYFFLTT